MNFNIDSPLGGRLARAARVLMRGVSRLTGALPWSLRRAMARHIGRHMARRHMRRHQTGRINMDLAFGERMSDAQKDRVLVSSFENFATCLVDSVSLIPTLTRANWTQRVTVPAEDIARLDTLREQGRGILVMFSHYGAWELMGAVMPFITRMQVHVVAKPQSPWLDPLIEGLRTATGNRVIYQRGAARATLKALKRNELVGLSIDQNFATGVFVPFFGIPAGTVDTLAALARTSGAPIVPLVCTPHATDGAYTGRLLAPIEPIRSGDRDADVHQITRACLAVLEELIRERPELWMWSNKRWKSRPPDEIPVRNFYPRKDPARERARP